MEQLSCVVSYYRVELGEVDSIRLEGSRLDPKEIIEALCSSTYHPFIVAWMYGAFRRQGVVWLTQDSVIAIHYS